jgi:hypothetical protein
MSSTDQEPEPSLSDWRPWLRGRILGLFVVKLLALCALWWLFFSPEHRPAADAEALAARWFAPTGTPVTGNPAHD